MRKLLTLLLILPIGAWARATVIDVVAVDIGLSGGRLGITSDDPLSPGDQIGLAIMLNHNPYHDYSTYDGYVLSSMDLDLHISGPATLTAEQGIQPPPPGTLPITIEGVSQSGIEQMAGIFPTPPLGPRSLLQHVYDLFLECNGAGEVTVDLTLYGLSEYAPFNDGDGGPWPRWEAMNEEDLGDLLIYQIPEPITMALLALGALSLRRRGRSLS